ncbi:Vancomycin resistance protein YoaR, contains peptidoglycan-binding and VanW domains [Nocardioides sp. YR527]|uniref:VanW family protein n=1 Tax=Nocardioides sp. YR527 TaxID=1881028 RepID=UPI00088DE1DB|nr:VanW family protein [Nocardioides sp. YR527]SDK78392.1 Vancomycin resistance protein YoaR, contains peptidoglycan-binding and VanW domains [Nocardioides sp. YR527]
MSTEPEAFKAPEPAKQTHAAGSNASQAGADDAAIETIMIPQIEIDARVAESTGAKPVPNDAEPDGATRVVPAGDFDEDLAEETLMRSTMLRSELPKRAELPEEDNFLFVSKNRKFAPEPDAVDAAPDLADDAATEVAFDRQVQDVPDFDDEPLEATVMGVGPFVVNEQATTEPSPFETAFEQPDYAQPVAAERKPLGTGAKVAVAVAGGVAVLAFVGWAAAYAVAGEKIPEGTTVAGVDIGGMTAAEATPLLDQKFAPAHSQPINVTAGDSTTEVNPADAGLSFDAEATIEKANAVRSWSPVKLWKHFTGGGEIEPVVKADDKLIAKVAAKVNKRAGTPFKDGDVVIKKGKVKTTQPVAGEGVSDDALRTALAGQLLVEGDRKADVPLAELTPDVDEADVQEAVDKVATPAVSGPITLKFEKTPVELSPKEFGDAIRFDPKDGELQASVAPSKLKKVLKKALADDAAKPVDATIKMVNGAPKVIPAKPGVTFNQKDLEAVFLDVVTAPQGERTVEVKSKVAKPKVTTEEAKAWGVKEKVSTFTTNFPYAEYRNVNIGRAAELVNGTVLAPGDTFSMNGIVGERTAANGFTKGWMIQNGVFREDYGGGVSQMATTTFNAMFFAGLQDVEHKAHSLYIDRYPIGREATVAWPSLDLKFKNNTKYGVLIRSWVNPASGSSQGSVTVEMWSTKIYDIKARTGDRYDFKSPGKQKITDGNCENTVGAQGFSINVWRDFYNAGSGSKVDTETFKTTYIPQDEVECTDESEKPPPPADPN